MRKMTCKEFKMALEEAGMPFDAYGWEWILNIISVGLRENAVKHREKGLNDSAQYEKKIADSICNTLKARGYYDE